MSPKPFIFPSQRAAGCGAWRGAPFPGIVTGLRGKNQMEYQENALLAANSQALSCFFSVSTAGIPGSPDRGHLTITTGERADLLWKNRINFVLHIQSAFFSG